MLLGAVGRVKDGHRSVWARDLPLRRQSHSGHISLRPVALAAPTALMTKLQSPGD